VNSDDMLRAFARLVAAEVVAILQPAEAKPYTSDPRALHLPPGYSKRQWDDAGRRAESDPKRPPLRKDPRGYSCPVATFDAWAAAHGRSKATTAETDVQRRARQLASVGLRRAG